MAAIYEEFIRCEKCGHPEFIQEKRYTFHKKVRPRKDVQEELPAIETTIAYVCANSECRHELSR